MLCQRANGGRKGSIVNELRQGLVVLVPVVGVLFAAMSLTASSICVILVWFLS